ncbi:MAG: STAS domain-containing protein [Streptosporangiaceae bacterium]
MSAADFTVRWSGTHVVVTMPAEIDVTNSASVDSVLSGVAAQHPAVITADMTSTVFCDSSGIHALARAHRRASTNGGELRIAVGTSPTMRVLELTGLDQVLAVYADVTESLAAPPGEPSAQG